MVTNAALVVINFPTVEEGTEKAEAENFLLSASASAISPGFSPGLPDSGR